MTKVTPLANSDRLRTAEERLREGLSPIEPVIQVSADSITTWLEGIGRDANTPCRVH